jgi:flavin-dependent dehydrogenase
LHQLPVIDIRAFPGPLGGQSQPVQKNNILLAGDSAQLVDPWLGEGIYYALTSGRLAAESIINSEEENREDISGYSRKINQALITQLASARKLSLAINLLPLINVLALSISPTLQNMIIGLLQGEFTHSEILATLKRQFPTLIWKIIRGQ